METPQQRRAVVNVPSIRQHIRCVIDRPSVVSWKCAESSLVSVEQQEDCSTEMVPWQVSSAGQSWFGLRELVMMGALMIVWWVRGKNSVLYCVPQLWLVKNILMSSSSSWMQSVLLSVSAWVYFCMSPYVCFEFGWSVQSVTVFLQSLTVCQLMLNSSYSFTSRCNQKLTVSLLTLYLTSTLFWAELSFLMPW